ncbi:GPR1/FUN34/yaaH family-domain-containing protein [Dichotomocladium elegans]|nr:GPR1/FUN34/yaaH family-domain-containing protein [Dichotomocladium elegans]
MESSGWTHDLEGNPDVRSPLPLRSDGKLAVPSSASAIHHEHPHHPYMVMTRAASPLVWGQANRRPLTMGNPGVLGLWSFSMVTILLGTYNLFLPHKSNHIIFPTALMYGGLAQYIAGLLDFFYGGTFSATILVSYGAFWAGQGLMMLPSVSTVLTAYESEWDIAQANAVYHFLWGFYTLMLLGISLKIKSGNAVLSWCLFWVFITLILTSIYYLVDIEALLRVSGVSAYLAALGAYYSGCAAVFEEQNEKWWVGKYPWVNKSE